MKKDEEERKEGEHHRLVSRMIVSAEGGAGLLHKITKPTAWRGGGIQVLEEEERDVRPLARCEEKMGVRTKHWQCNTEVQDLKDKAWRHEELKRLEEGIPRLKEGDSEKAGEITRQRRVWDVMEFHQKVPPDLSEETRGKIVEQCGRWPQQACTTIFFLIPKNVTSERPITLMPTMIRRWERLRAPEVATWQ